MGFIHEIETIHSPLHDKSAYAGLMIGSSVLIEELVSADWPQVCSIYMEGILSGNSTFETEAPSWEEWDRNHLPFARLSARAEEGLVAWAALSPVSQRACYAGVAEVSIYVATMVRGQGIGRSLLREVIRQSEPSGIWTLQGSIFPENVASLRMCVANGFRQVGRRKHIAKLNGLWRDTVLVERRSDRAGTV
jgi:phosphinothricin acetyltransferase